MSKSPQGPNPIYFSIFCHLCDLFGRFNAKFSILYAYDLNQLTSSDIWTCRHHNDYSACAKKYTIIWSVHNISKREMEDGLRIRLNHETELVSPSTGFSATQIAFSKLIPQAKQRACGILVY